MSRSPELAEFTIALRGQLTAPPNKLFAAGKRFDHSGAKLVTASGAVKHRRRPGWGAYLSDDGIRVLVAQLCELRFASERDGNEEHLWIAGCVLDAHEREAKFTIANRNRFGNLNGPETPVF